MTTRRTLLASAGALAITKPVMADHDGCHETFQTRQGDWDIQAGSFYSEGRYIVNANSYHAPSTLNIAFPVYDGELSSAVSQRVNNEAYGFYTTSDPFARNDQVRNAAYDDAPPIPVEVVFINDSTGQRRTIGGQFLAPTTAQKLNLQSSTPTNRVLPYSSAKYSPSNADIRSIAEMLFNAFSEGQSIDIEFRAIVNGSTITTSRYNAAVKDFYDIHDWPYDVRAGKIVPAKAECTDCFLTSACCTLLGRPDDGFELSTLRKFRDNWLARHPNGLSEIATYYKMAPTIGAAIQKDPNRVRILVWIYLIGILPAIAAIKLGQNRMAYNIYKNRLAKIAARYGYQI